MDRTEVLALYEEGVAAIEEFGLSVSSDQWKRPACGTWTGTDVAGHLVCVAGWYHAWLDSAEAGNTAPPFGAAALAERNAAALSALGPEDGSARVRTFAKEARRYAARVVSAWDLPYGFPYGTITAGLHAGVAAGEWHLHAWDLTAGRHRPRDPRGLFRAVGGGLMAARGGVVGWLGSASLPLAALRQPWQQMLKRSGR